MNSVKIVAFKIMAISLVLALVIPVAHAQESRDAPEQTDADKADASKAPSPVLKELETNHQQLKTKAEEIAALEEKIRQLQSQRNSAESTSQLIASQLDRLEQTLQKTRLEMRQTSLGIAAVQVSRKKTETTMQNLREEIEQMRQQLRQMVRLRYQQEQQSLVEIFLQELTLSAVLAEHAAWREVQDQITAMVKDMHQQTEDLKGKQLQLGEEEQELSRLSAVLTVQGDELEGLRQQKEKFLTTKQKEKVTYEKQLAEAIQARQEIEQSVFKLGHAGVTLKLTEAVDMARYASRLTGVRPALLMGILKVESNIGTQLGSGTFPQDMHPSSREAFLRLTKKLSLDPNKAPISARPRSYSGWGGAMGPGQFMPDTWETIEARVAHMMGKTTVNPYELVDTFVATGLVLADRGAAEASKEYEAVNRYLAGPNWQYFTWYGDRVLAVADEYEKNEYEKEGVL